MNLKIKKFEFKQAKQALDGDNNKWKRVYQIEVT